MGDVVSTLEDRRLPSQRGPHVTVVGAGPAGLACAISLARSGLKVIVRERHAEVGHRFHGDFQGLENWTGDKDVLDELSMAGIAAGFEHYPVSRGTVFDARGRRYALQSKRPLFYLVRRGCQRGSLDCSLLEQAIALGVQVRFDDKVDIADQQPGVLAAGPRVADAIAAGYIFETSSADGAFLALDDRLAPLGYAYLLIHKGRGTIASCMFTAFKRQSEYVARTVAFFVERVGLVMKDPQPFGGFANFHLARSAIQGGHLVVGEHSVFRNSALSNDRRGGMTLSSLSVIGNALRLRSADV